MYPRIFGSYQGLNHLWFPAIPGLIQPFHEVWWHLVLLNQIVDSWSLWLYLACGWYGAFKGCQFWDVPFTIPRKGCKFQKWGLRKWGIRFDFFEFLTCCTCCRMIIRGGGGVLTFLTSTSFTLRKMHTLRMLSYDHQGGVGVGGGGVY